MSAPHIPNLNTLRRGGLRTRGRGASTALSGGGRSNDQIIQNTDNDAATSRMSAVDAGYLEDHFAKLLTTEPVQRRLPLMNRGTYVRTVGIDKIVDTFLSSQSGRMQIISLGAGSDTRYFRLRQKRPNLDLVYHEIDFGANTNIKIERLKSPTFSTVVRNACSISEDDFQYEDGNLASENYYIHACDLRLLPKSFNGIDQRLPTLLISECCLIYLSPAEAQNVMTYFTNMFSNTSLAITIYEPIRPYDPFGKTMVKNLTARGLYLQTMEKYSNLEEQKARLDENGFESRAEDMNFIWHKWIEDAEKERIDSLEWMDEIEEFVLLAKHYCISWGWRGWINTDKWKELPTSRPEIKQQKHVGGPDGD